LKEGPDNKKKTELADLEVPQEGESGPAEASGPDYDEQLKGVLSDEEMGLFSELLRKVESTGDLDRELNLDLSQFTERVESVVDSIERIENIERTQMERLLYKEGIAPVEEGDVSIPPAEPISDTPAPSGGPDHPSPQSIIETVPEITALGGSHIEITGSEPYADIKAEGAIRPSFEISRGTYEANLDNVLLKLKKLAELKLQRSDLKEAMGLVNIAMKVGGSTETFRREYALLVQELGLEMPSAGPTSTAVATADMKVPVQDVEGVEEARVLAPELAGQIGSLQKRARSALAQLKVMLESANLQGEYHEKVKALYQEANALFRDNRFHKAHQVALSALSTIKDRVKDDIDVQLQNDLFQARELLDELARSEEQYDVMVIEDLREQLDKAMKFYLTNEYERANLIGKTVMASLKDLKEPEGSKVREKVLEVKRDVNLLKEQNLDLEGLKEAEEIVRSMDELMSRRDYSNCTKLMETLTVMVSELKQKSDNYSRSKEMSIRLTNRIARLSQGDYDLREVEKKLSFLKGYFQDSRYEDALLIGAEIEVYLESMENLKKEMEAKEIFTELENLMLHVDEMEGAERLRDDFSVLRSKYVMGDHNHVKVQGREFLETMRKKTKALKVERAKRISSSVIESKLLAMKLRSMNRDTTEHERAARKARTLIKEGNPVEGLRQLDRVNSAMRDELQQNVDFLRNYVSIYRDSLEVLLDRHRSEPLTYYIRNRQVPILRRMEQLGRLNKALESYRKLENRFSELKVPLDKRAEIESNLTDLRFELYKRKDMGLDITEPLSIYNRAQKVFSEGKVIMAEYLTEVTKRYYERFLPLK
jgi:hypothetical protein